MKDSRRYSTASGASFIVTVTDGWVSCSGSVPEGVRKAADFINQTKPPHAVAVRLMGTSALGNGGAEA